MVDHDDYYDYRAAMLSTAAHVRRLPDGRYEVRNVCARGDHEETLGYSSEELADIERNDGTIDTVVAEVTDNGDMGDGLCIKFRTSQHARDREENLLFLVELTPKQARVLALALNHAAEFRELTDRRPR